MAFKQNVKLIVVACFNFFINDDNEADIENYTITFKTQTGNNKLKVMM